MTLEEAIIHCEEVAKKNKEECINWAYGASQINDDENRKKQYLKHAEMWQECANEHRQLAEWLKELQQWREFGNKIGQVCAEFLTDEQIEKLKEVNADEHE